MKGYYIWNPSSEARAIVVHGSELAVSPLDSCVCMYVCMCVLCVCVVCVFCVWLIMLIPVLLIAYVEYKHKTKSCTNISLHFDVTCVGYQQASGYTY